MASAPSSFWRRLRQHFSIDAPRMAVRSHLPWPWRAVVVVALLALVGGMWWWGYDFGQIFGGFNRKEVESRLVTLEADSATLTRENAALRAGNTALESELAMARGAQATMQRQVEETTAENTQLREELAFLQKLVVDSNKQPGVSIPRLGAERAGEEVWNYSLLVVRGGNPKGEFEGQVTLSATVAPTSPEPGAAVARPVTISLPEDQPATAPALKLRFKYYQRLEGSFRVPPGHAVKTIGARVHEAGAPSPRATRNLIIP